MDQYIYGGNIRKIGNNIYCIFVYLYYCKYTYIHHAGSVSGNGYLKCLELWSRENCQIGRFNLMVIGTLGFSGDFCTSPWLGIPQSSPIPGIGALTVLSQESFWKPDEVWAELVLGTGTHKNTKICRKINEAANDLVKRFLWTFMIWSFW